MDLPDLRMLRCVWSSGGFFSEDITESCRNPNWCVGSALNDSQTQPSLDLHDKPHSYCQAAFKKPTFTLPWVGKTQASSEEGWDFHWRKQYCPAIAWDREQPRLVFATVDTAGIAARIWAEVRLFSLEEALHSACLVARGWQGTVSRPQKLSCTGSSAEKALKYSRVQALVFSVLVILFRMSFSAKGISDK